MSAWAAIAAKGAAVTTSAVVTSSAGTGRLLGVAPSTLDGFAAGAVLTGACFMVIVAPRTFWKSRLSARRGRWSASVRHARVRPDYYAAPTDTYSLADPSDLAASAAAEAAAAEAPLAFADPALEVCAPASSQDFAGHAGADPYALGQYAAAGQHGAGSFAADPHAAGPYAEGPYGSDPDGDDPYGLDPHGADPFGVSADDDIVLPGDDADEDESERVGYRSRHGIMTPENSGRRPDSRRSAPRHAAPSARFGSRLSSKLAVIPLVAARG